MRKVCLPSKISDCNDLFFNNILISLCGNLNDSSIKILSKYSDIDLKQGQKEEKMRERFVGEV